MVEQSEGVIGGRVVVGMDSLGKVVVVLIMISSSGSAGFGKALGSSSEGSKEGVSGTLAVTRTSIIASFDFVHCSSKQASMV